MSFFVYLTLSSSTNEGTLHKPKTLANGRKGPKFAFFFNWRLILLIILYSFNWLIWEKPENHNHAFLRRRNSLQYDCVWAKYEQLFVLYFWTYCCYQLNLRIWVRSMTSQPNSLDNWSLKMRFCNNSVRFSLFLPGLS